MRHWARERGIYTHSSAQSQLLKALSELGELADATLKGDRFASADAVGDVLVCLINYCHLAGLKPFHCLASAYNQIKNRKGHMSAGGAFVKEGG